MNIALDPIAEFCALETLRPNVADSCNSWHGTVSMCRNSLWQEQTGSSMLHTFITTPKTYIIMIGANLCDPKELLQHTNMKHFVSGLFVHIMFYLLYLLLIRVGVWLFVTLTVWIDWRIQFDSFITFFLKW